MEANATSNHEKGPRHSILNLAPLELECMSVLWPLGEGTVRDIHGQLAASRPRAYTTIMTIMDRLAHKGIVTRRRVGRAYRYQANLTAEEARVSAIEKIVAGFFAGSTEALVAHLASAVPSVVNTPVRSEQRLAMNDANRTPLAAPKFTAPVDRMESDVEESGPQPLDETLL